MNKNSQNQNNSKNGGADHRSDTRKHQYKDHEEVNTNDENFDPDTQKFIGEEEPDFDDKLNNEDKK